MPCVVLSAGCLALVRCCVCQAAVRVCLQVNCKVTHPTGGAATNITLSEGDYFGELALQGQFKSASTLVAGKTGALAMSISQEEFSKCCGPLGELYSQVRSLHACHPRPTLRTRYA